MQTTLPIGILIKERYLVQDLLSKSSSGAVYLVEDQSVKNKNNTLFALKEVINPSKHKLYQIAVEGMSLRLLYHQALPQVYNVINMGKPDRVYIPLDYIEGPNLEVLRLRQPEKRFSLPLVMAIMAPIMDAVTYLHSQRSPIIHQDIKPTNIIISKGESRKRTDKVVLVDFGIGKNYNFNSINGVNHRSLTSYEAPEQYSGNFTTRSDIYGLGATFYSLLTGIDPPDALSRESKSSSPLKPVNQLVPGVSTLVATCIDRAMSLSSNDRFPTVEQFQQALKADPAWQQAQKLNLRKVAELDLTLKGDSSLQQSSKCSAALSIEEQLPPSEGAASTSEDQQVLDVASTTLIDQQLLASNNAPSDTMQQATVPGVSPLIPIDQQVTIPDVDQPLPVAEAALADILDRQPLEPVNASFTLGDQQLAVGALNGMALLTPGSLSPPQTSHDDYSHLWPDVNIEMSFSQAGCEWFVRTQEPQNNHRKDLHRKVTFA